jgi:hypothetical protein
VGYWAPPLPSAYDPAPRPLRHYPAVVAGQNVQFPEPEDAEYFGIGVSSVGGAEPLPAMAPLTGSIARLGKPNHVVTFAGWGGNASTQSPLDRLWNYQRLIALRAPTDPDGGGLAADWVDPDGTIHINYFDFSDEHEPRRKRVAFTPKEKGGVDVKVEEWSPDQGWHDEGFDFERDFTSALVPIMQALQAVSTAIVSVLATPAVGAAWSAAMQFGVDAAAGRTPPSIEAAFGVLVQFGGAMNLGGVLASKEGKDVIAGFYKSVEKTVGSDFLGKLGNLAAAVPKSFPKVNVPAALIGKIPDELIALDKSVFGDVGPAIPNGVSDVFVKAARAYAAIRGGAPKDVAYSIRKTIDAAYAGLPDGKGEFDLTLASMQASELDVDPRALADQASDPTSTMTFHQVLAMGKQSATELGAEGTMTFRQAYAKSGAALRNDVEAGKETTKVVAGAALLALVAKLFFF